MSGMRGGLTGAVPLDNVGRCGYINFCSVTAFSLVPSTLNFWTCPDFEIKPPTSRTSAMDRIEKT